MGVQRSMQQSWSSNKDCLGLRKRVSGLHQTWKWLHQTAALHEYLISVASEYAAVAVAKQGNINISTV